MFVQNSECELTLCVVQCDFAAVSLDFGLPAHLRFCQTYFNNKSKVNRAQRTSLVISYKFYLICNFGTICSGNDLV